MSIFSRKRGDEDVPEIRVDGEQATVESRADDPDPEDPEPRAPQAAESRTFRLPKTKWWS